MMRCFQLLLRTLWTRAQQEVGTFAAFGPLKAVVREESDTASLRKGSDAE